MKRSLKLAVAVALPLVAGLAVLWLGYPPVAKAQKGCTAQMLRGEYGVHLQGWIYPDWPQKTRVPGSQIGIGSFDGSGNAVMLVTSAVDGEIGPPDTIEYTYEVNADCTGSITPRPGANGGPGRFVIVDGGRQFLGMGTQPGMVWSGTGIRQ
ncbi:MAG: hypothetical protein ACE15B_04510 [Bryobacteraceae bacterium]